MAEKREKINDATKDAERRDASAEHGAPQVPTAEEAAAADRHGTASEQTAEHYEEMTEKGAAQKGEGRLP
jgi:hypothetical protein